MANVPIRKGSEIVLIGMVWQSIDHIAIQNYTTTTELNCSANWMKIPKFRAAHEIEVFWASKVTLTI